MAEKTITDILESLARIETNVASIAKHSADHETRLRTLEQRSGKRAEQITLAVITSLLVAIAGYAVGKLF